MAVTNFSPLLGLALPTTGDLSGTWGVVVNDSITQLLDSAVAGTTVLSSDADVTLSTTNGAANQARNAVIRWTATGSVTRYITAPAQSKAYVVINATGGSQSIVIRGAGPTAGVTILAGRKALVAWNGSDFVEIAGGKVDLTTDVTGVLPVANGGTNFSSYTTGDIVYASGATALTKRNIGSTGQVLTVAGGVPTWATPASELPDQTGHAGEYLTTDGTNASWTATGAAAGGGIYVNNTTISQNYTIISGQNGFSVGPMVIASGYAVTVSSGEAGMSAMMGSSLDISIRGDNYDEIADTGQQLFNEIQDVDGVTELALVLPDMEPKLNIIPEMSKMMASGLSMEQLQQIGQEFMVMTMGAAVSSVNIDGETYEIYVNGIAGDLDSAETAAELRVGYPNTVMLGDIATVTLG